MSVGEAMFISNPTIALALGGPGGGQDPASQLGHSSGLCIEVRPWVPLPAWALPVHHIVFWLGVPKFQTLNR